MQMILDASAFIFFLLSLLNTPRRYVSSSLGCLRGLHLSITYRHPQTVAFLILLYLVP